MPREKFKLWVGRTDNSQAPENVQLRVLNRYKASCAGCQRKLMMGEKWELDHVIPLEDGGVNAEGNLQPLCKACHGSKTGTEATQRAKVRAMAKAAYGIKAAKQKIPSRPRREKPVRDRIPEYAGRRVLYVPGQLMQPIGGAEIDGD